MVKTATDHNGEGTLWSERRQFGQNGEEIWSERRRDLVEMAKAFCDFTLGNFLTYLYCHIAHIPQIIDK